MKDLYLNCSEVQQDSLTVEFEQEGLRFNHKVDEGDNCDDWKYSEVVLNRQSVLELHKQIESWLLSDKE